MAQYQTYNDGQLIEYTDGVAIYRNGSLNKSFVLLKAITALGFAGIENIDWITLYALSMIGVLGVFRNGVRAGDFVLDEAITALAFDGVESSDGGVTGDWIKIYTFD
jgi:hypothetical protein